MSADLAAAYCGEKDKKAFLRRIGSEYPRPRLIDGRRQLWLRDDLDAAILPKILFASKDIAEDL
jgi:hypothetical protein